MAADLLQSWFRAAQRRWPLVRWDLARFGAHVGTERPAHPEDLYLGGAASERLQQAWETIDAEFRAEVVRRVTRLGRKSDGPEDLWSEAMVRLMSEDPDGMLLPDGRRSGRIRRFRGSVPLPSYISVVAKRIALDRVRRDTVRREIGMNRALVASGRTATPDEQASHSELAGLLAREFADAFTTLTPTRQALLSLVYGQGMAKMDAGQLLGMRDYQVSRELKSSMEALRDRLELLRPGEWSPELSEAWVQAWTAARQPSQEALDEQA